MNRTAGFSLVQLLVTAVIIGIVSRITITQSLASWRDAQLGALSNQFAAWLEEISLVPEQSGGSCSVSISTGTLSNGATLASVTPSSCSTTPSFLLSSQFNSRQISVGAASSTIVFTPRSAITSASDVQVRLAVLNQTPVRCVRLSAVLGLIQLGRNDTSSNTSSDCPAASFDAI